jgi:hypothetical protein
MTKAKTILIYRVACPYCEDGHVVESPYWDDIEKTFEECMRKASPEILGRLAWVNEQQRIPWCRGETLERAA